MPRARKSLAQIWTEDPNHTSRQIFNELELYAKDRQFYPVQFALFRYMTGEQWNPKTRRKDPPRYPKLKLWHFNYWFERMVSEGYIEIDPDSRAIRCTHLEIVEKEDINHKFIE